MRPTDGYGDYFYRSEDPSDMVSLSLSCFIVQRYNSLQSPYLWNRKSKKLTFSWLLFLWYIGIFVVVGFVLILGTFFRGSVSCFWPDLVGIRMINFVFWVCESEVFSADFRQVVNVFVRGFWDFWLEDRFQFDVFGLFDFRTWSRFILSSLAVLLFSMVCIFTVSIITNILLLTEMLYISEDGG